MVTDLLKASSIQPMLDDILKENNIFRFRYHLTHKSRQIWQTRISGSSFLSLADDWLASVNNSFATLNLCPWILLTLKSYLGTDKSMAWTDRKFRRWTDGQRHMNGYFLVRDKSSIQAEGLKLSGDKSRTRTDRFFFEIIIFWKDKLMNSGNRLMEIFSGRANPGHIRTDWNFRDREIKKTDKSRTQTNQ